MSEEKGLLRFGYDITLCLSLDGALEIMRILSRENLMQQTSKYEKGESTEILRVFDGSRLTLSLITPAEYMMRTIAGEESEK